MILIIWLDLKNWYLNFSTQTLTTYLCGLGILGLLTYLRPKVTFETLLVLSLWLGLLYGKEKWGHGRLQSFIYETNTRPPVVVLGKILSFFLLCLLHIIFVLPLLLLTVLFWGVSWDVFLGIILLILTASSLAAAMGLLVGNVLTDARENLLGEFILGVYLLVTTYFEKTKIINPLVVVFRVLTPGQGNHLKSAFYINSLLLLITLIMIWLPYREKGRDERS